MEKLSFFLHISLIEYLDLKALLDFNGSSKFLMSLQIPKVYAKKICTYYINAISDMRIRFQKIRYQIEGFVEYTLKWCKKCEFSFNFANSYTVKNFELFICYYIIFIYFTRYQVLHQRKPNPSPALLLIYFVFNSDSKQSYSTIFGGKQ